MTVKQAIPKCNSLFLQFMKDFKTFIRQIEQKFSKQELPGLEAQMKMVPVTRLKELRNKTFDSPPKKSAVLILFYPDNEKIKFVMIKRPRDNSVHSGQIAFPGGSYETEDQTLSRTALREANEEVNINPRNVVLLGQLTNIHINPSNFDVTPFVGYSLSRPPLHGNNEVDRILEISLDELSDPGTITRKVIRNRQGLKFEVPCFLIQDEIIWGASAMMLAELMSVIGMI